MEPITFRPERSTAALYFGLFQIPVVFVLVVHLIDWEMIGFSAAVICLLFGALAAYCGAGLLCLRTVVDGAGIRRCPWWFGGYRVRWEDVIWWSVRPFDPIDSPDGCRVLELTVRGRFWLVRIHDAEVARPGLDALVERVKARPGVSE